MTVTGFDTDFEKEARMDARRVLQRFQDKANRISRNRNETMSATGFIFLSICVVIIVAISSLVVSPVKLIAYIVKQVKRLIRKGDGQPKD